MTSVQPTTEETPKQVQYWEPSYPPPPQPPPPAYATTVITAQPGVYIHSQPRFHLMPVRMVCTGCNNEIITSVEYKIGLITFVWCFLIAFLGCIFGCCFVPFFMDSAKDAHHKCPNCKRLLGVHKKF